MLLKSRFQRVIFTFLFSMSPTLAIADCEIYELPSICDPVAQTSIHWVGEYSGETTSFKMLINNMPFTPPYEKSGTMTLFELDGVLGFAGGGAFEGTADLERSPIASTDTTETDEDWDWLWEPDVLDELSEQHAVDTDNPGSCQLRWWPRWTGYYHPPNSPEMRLTLIATAFDQLLGRVFYQGTQNGSSVLIDSRFTIRNVGFDPSGYETMTYSDDSQECEAHCTPGAETHLCSVQFK